MSITTKKGDSGQTSLMYNRRVSKCHPRLEALGTVDELNSALGMARATATHDFVRTHLVSMQHDLITLMGELATTEADLDRFGRDGFQAINAQHTAKLEALAHEIEHALGKLQGWALSGDHLHPAALDVARTTCRRAERRVCALSEAGDLANAQILIYLNRLADVLWLLARWVEHQVKP